MMSFQQINGSITKYLATFGGMHEWVVFMESRSQAFTERRPYYDKGSFWWPKALDVS